MQVNTSDFLSRFKQSKQKTMRENDLKAKKKEAMENECIQKRNGDE